MRAKEKDRSLAVAEIKHLTANWAGVRSGLLETIDKFADAELGFTPFEGSRTVRALMLHIAQEERGEFEFGVTRTLEAFPHEYEEAEFPTRAAIKAVLAQVHEPVTEYVEKLRDEDLDRVVETPWAARPLLADMLAHLLVHEIHHRGELSLILGLLGREGLDA